MPDPSPDEDPNPDDDGAPNEPGMSRVVHRNIVALTKVRQREERQRGFGDRLADLVTRFAGSIWCVAVHIVYFGGWITINLGWVPGVEPFDPFPFVMLAMIASVEAIFLSTFILISQNRMAQVADQRAELDLQISLLSEHELTRVVRLLDEVAKRLEVERPPEEELMDVKKDVNPTKVVKDIEQANQAV